jgi:hypothetical protein
MRKTIHLSLDEAKSIITKEYLVRHESNACIVSNLKLFEEMKLSDLTLRLPATKLLMCETYLFNINDEEVLIITKTNSLQRVWDYYQE